MPTKRNSLTPAEFVTLWQRSKTLADFTEASGVDPLAASMRAVRYRKAGIPLKRFKGRRPPLDVKALAALAKKEAP